ncbi:MAG: tRNA (guanosine(37)-N1)-methyltransferase TrmD [candidate division Zixibacteria bacterium RBG_16_50_21]|nr:MAG: tRNA (guanosine(37)-N1)-methyltransferase TrmD [candidate division Zixibacteria bacterium RBG_16_50_21]
MKIKILTVFPQMVEPFLRESMLQKAVEKELVEFEVIDIRDFSTDKHKTVDDTPFGGGGGMVLKPEPIVSALEDALAELKKPRIILTSASGRTFCQESAQKFSQEKSLVFICGHYAGVDERVKELFQVEEISIGDFVLTGGEIPALAMIDATVRLIPGVLGNFDSAENDSFQKGLLGYPHYTKPQEFRGKKVPEVLISGNHKEIAKWRRQKALEITYLNRRDLLERIRLTKEDHKLVDEIKKTIARKG